FVVNVDLVPERRTGESDEDYEKRRVDAYLGTGTPEYEDAWEKLKYFVDACFERGFKVWIYDELKYPSGAAGNKVIKTDPDYQVKGLVCFSCDADGGCGTLECADGDLVFAGAYPILENGLLDAENVLSVKAEDGKVLYDLPDGRYKVCAFYTKKLAFLTENLVPYTDLMRADAVDCFIEVTHGEYLKHLGEETISKITAFFTDEPGLPTHGCSSYFYEKGAICAWTEELSRIFPELPSRCVDIFFDTKRNFLPCDADFRRSYWQEVSRLFSENYFGRIAAWCQKHGTRMTGHLYGEETLGMQIGLNADLFGLMRHMQMPGVDRLYCTEPRDVIAEKTATSVAHMYGREYTMSENSFHLEKTFWDMGDSINAFNRQNSAYYQIQLGLTNISSYFTYQPYKEDAERRAFEICTARAAEFMATGTHKADILVLIPMESAWEQFTPQDHKYWLIGPCIVAPYQHQPLQILEKAYGETLKRLEDGRLDFDLTDSRGLAECTVENGLIKTPYESFCHLVVFDSGYLTDDVCAQIEKFLESGGTVTAVDAVNPSENCRIWAKKYPERFIRSGFENICGAVLSGNAGRTLELIAPDTVRVRKSETDDAELWFIHNRADACTVTVCERGDFVKMTPDSENISHIYSDGSFTMTMDAGSVVMLVREK
ncbi:MAG: hypothetical protein IKV97_00690, partial [Clostridia bacterium]|nr:hypothetical protein [Clostridia bacterium]